MASARRQILSEQVAARIKQLIIDEHLKPGDRLPTELEMASRFGVSRVSVREATKALSFLGIIQAAPRRGLTIGEVDMQRVSEYLGFHFVINKYPKRELLQTRLVIETGALPFAAKAISTDASMREKLESMLDDAERLSTDTERVNAEVAFHRALLEASGVGPLLVFDNFLQIFFSMFAPTWSVAPWEQASGQHRELVQLLSQGDLEQARQLLLQHLLPYSGALEA